MATSSNQLEQTPLCTFCKEEKKTEWICSDCDKPLCYECKRHHLWDYERKDHNIVRAISLESSTKKKPVLKNIFCEDHVGRYCTNYCIECRCLVCPECVSINSCHTGHTFKTIDKFHKETLEKLDYLENHIQQTLLGSVTLKLKSLKDWYNFHQKKFEEEKEKILNHADDLRKWITEYSDKLVDELEQSFARNANFISQEKFKLEQFQRELNEKIKFINESKVKDDIEQIQKDICNEFTNIKHFDTYLYIPKETKDFSVAKVTGESLISICGSLQPFDRTADVECKIIKSYNLKGFIDQHYQKDCKTSVAISSDGTIYFAKKRHLFELKPDKSPAVVVVLRRKITDILFLETNEIIFAVNGVVLVKKKEHEKIQTLYELERNYLVLSLCRNRDGNIMILYRSNKETLFEFILSSQKPFCIEVISFDGVKVKEITIKHRTKSYRDYEKILFYEGSISLEHDKAKMTEDSNKNICILDFTEENIKAYNQEGKLMWLQKVCCPIDMESTPLGSTVVLCGGGRLHILESDGKLVKMINLWEENNLQYQQLHTCSLCFKNNRELAVLCDEKLYIVHFSFSV